MLKHQKICKYCCKNQGIYGYIGDKSILYCSICYSEIINISNIYTLDIREFVNKVDITSEHVSIGTRLTYRELKDRYEKSGCKLEISAKDYNTIFPKNIPYRCPKDKHLITYKSLNVFRNTLCICLLCKDEEKLALRINKITDYLTTIGAIFIKYEKPYTIYYCKCGKICRTRNDKILKIKVGCGSCTQKDPEIREKFMKTCFGKYKVCNPMQSESVQEKCKQTFLKKYNVEYIFHNKDIQKKIRQTMLQRYNVLYSMQNKDVIGKRINTWMKNYNVPNPFLDKTIQEKCRKTWIAKYNVSNPMKDKDIQKKYRQTCFRRYNVENISQDKNIRKKIRKIWLDKYGVDHPSQHPDVLAKILASSFSTKPHTYPSGRTVDIMGYEGSCLDILVKRYLEEQIYIGLDVPIISYNFGDIDRQYFPDIYIPDENLLIEVKSVYTYELEIDQNHAKFIAATLAGYRFFVYIFSDKKKLDRVLEYLPNNIPDSPYLVTVIEHTFLKDPLSPLISEYKPEISQEV